VGLLSFRNCINCLTFHGFHGRRPVLWNTICCNEVLVYTALLLLYQSHRYHMFRPNTIRPSYRHTLIWRAQYWNNRWFPSLVCKYRGLISVTVLGRVVGRERAALLKWLGPCTRRESRLTCNVCVRVRACVRARGIKHLYGKVVNMYGIVAIVGQVPVLSFPCFVVWSTLPTRTH
jgi:hypothetical protein